MSSQQIETLKTQGNSAFSAGRYSEAIEIFSQAIAQDENNHVLYSNRSASYASLKDYDLALQDAEKAITLKGDWSKGWGRKAAALFGLGLLEDARASYERGLVFEPSNNALVQGLDMVKKELALREQPPRSPNSERAALNNPFADPQLMQKLAASPKTGQYMSDPAFKEMIAELQRDPKSLTKHLKDPRIMEAFGVMLGVDVGVTDPPSTKAPIPEESKKNSSDNHASSPFQQPSASTKAKSTATTTPSKTATPEEEQASREKELGNEAYKKKDFENALKHYEAAFTLDPKNISILTNKSAVYFEMGDFDTCIAVCNEAVNKGRAIFADYKIIAKAFGRMGSVYEKKGNLEEAIRFYDKSLTEHRTPEILNKRREAEATLATQKKAAYHNPAVAEEHRSKGNDLFKQGNFVDAVKEYTEAIRRDESDPRGWSNRAACYMKLAAVPEGIKDCDKAIALDPSFIKAYIRKAALLHLKKDYVEALELLDKATALDSEGKHTQEIQQQSARCYQDLRRQQSASGNESEEEVMKRAMANPEIAEILQDPAMREILRQMQTDPRAAMEHLKNPTISSRIRKLAAAGVIRMGH